MESARETTHTPQGDGNSFISRMDSSRMIGNNPHPARGRKHQLLALDLHPVCLETTHTPQGDGNYVAAILFISSSWKQPTPRKGTETGSSPRKSSAPWKQPTPRQGTKTNNPRSACKIHEGNTLHPDRGQLTKKERETR